MASGRVLLAGLHPDVKRAAEWAIGWADFYGVPVRITSGFRGWAEQIKLRRRFERCVAEGRFPSPGPCQFPANEPGDSSHNFGLSFDSTTEPRFQAWWNHVRRLAGFEVLAHDEIHAQVPSWRQFV